MSDYIVESAYNFMAKKFIQTRFRVCLSLVIFNAQCFLINEKENVFSYFLKKIDVSNLPQFMFIFHCHISCPLSFSKKHGKELNYCGYSNLNHYFHLHVCPSMQRQSHFSVSSHQQLQRPQQCQSLALPNLEFIRAADNFLVPTINTLGCEAKLLLGCPLSF